jgi:glycosyltransferase involved in cell wall biosynthesis
LPIAHESVLNHTPTPGAGRRRIVVCTPFPPHLDARHGGKATSQLLLRLADRHDVALLSIRARKGDRVDPAIADRCALVVEIERSERRFTRRVAWTLGLLRGIPPWAVDCRSRAYRSALERILDEWHPDVVEIHFQAMAQYVDAAAGRNLPRILVDYDPASAWALEMLRSADGPRRLARRAEVAAWRHNERTTRPRFDAVVVFAERDRAEVAPTAGHAEVVRIPLAVEVPLRALDAQGVDPPTILFVGGFAHPPNVDAAVWLGSSIFPRVLESVPDARLDVVGHEPGDEVRALARGAVSVHASVPDVTPYVDRAAVVVAPIRLGGSMRMKVLEALAAGKALVATPRAAEGIEAVPGEHFVLAETEDEIVTALVQLLRDRERRRSLGERARAWAETTLGWGVGVEAFERLYNAVVERHAGDVLSSGQAGRGG